MKLCLQSQILLTFQLEPVRVNSGRYWKSLKLNLVGCHFIYIKTVQVRIQGRNRVWMDRNTEIIIQARQILYFLYRRHVTTFYCLWMVKFLVGCASAAVSNRSWSLRGNRQEAFCWPPPLLSLSPPVEWHVRASSSTCPRLPLAPQRVRFRYKSEKGACRKKKHTLKAGILIIAAQLGY